jgi:hypothetical protein
MAHSAAPALSAPEAAVGFWLSLQAWASEFNRGRTRVFDQVSPSLRAWSSGDDGLEGWASLRLGTRLPPGLSPEDWLDRLRSLDSTALTQADGFSTAAYRMQELVPDRAFLRAIRGKRRAGVR